MRPLIERKRRLKALIRQPGALMFADHVEREGTALYRIACDRDLEGVVAKRMFGLYSPEETSWVKIRNPQVFTDSQDTQPSAMFKRSRKPLCHTPPLIKY
jgi:ATP-dependent DNA ligase